MTSCVYSFVNLSRKAPSSPAGAASAQPQEVQRLYKQWFEAHGPEDLTAETFLKVVRAAERALDRLRKAVEP